MGVFEVEGYFKEDLLWQTTSVSSHNVTCEVVSNDKSSRFPLVENEKEYVAI